MASRNILLKMVADVTGAKAGIAETTHELKKFGEYTAEATVKLQTEGVQAKLDKLNAQLKRYGEQPHTADVKIRMGNVARQIERTELQLRALTERPHEIKVGVNERSFIRVRERIGKLSFGDTVGKAGTAAFAATGLGFGLAEIIKNVTEAYGTEQAAQARLRTQLDALNISYEDHARRIEEVIQRTSTLSGLTGHDLSDAFTNIVRSTGKVGQSLELVGLAADIARAKNLDVGKAGQLVGKVAAGNVSALTRYGIVMKKGATATEALGILQRRFGGQAAAYGRTQKGSIDRMNVAFEHLREVIGKGIAPTLTRAANVVARFVRQMLNGRGAGGRFVAVLRAIASVFRVVAAAARASIRAIIEQLGGAVGVIRGIVQLISGVLTGNFSRMWKGVRGIFSGSIHIIHGLLSAAISPFIAIGRSLGEGFVNGLIDVVNAGIKTLNKVLGPRDLGPFGHTPDLRIGEIGHVDFTSGPSGVKINNRNGTDVPAGADPRGVFSGGARSRPARAPRTAKQILANLGSGSQVTTRNLNLGVDQAERAYVAAVRKHGANSPQAIQAAADLEGARSSLHDFEHPARTATQRAAANRRRRRRRQQAAAANPDATPQDLATERAAQRYADVVRRYGAGSPQAKRAREEGNVTTARATIQTITARMVADLHKYGAGSQRVARDQTALARARVRLTTATEQLTKAVKKNTDQTSALLPRLTDVAYHPISGRMQHTPTRHGIGAAGHKVHQTINNNITTPGGIQYPDAEAFAAGLQRKLAAKGNG